MLRAGGSSKWQEDVQDVGDPSDWLGGSYAFLKELDGTLRCEICSDILRAPVSIKKCSHVFCSTCIRDYINQPSAPGAPTERPCPNCRQPKVYDSELVPMPQLEMAAEAWRGARAHLQRKDTEERAAAARVPEAGPSEPPPPPASSSNGKKRRIDDEAAETSTTRVTRSSSSRAARKDRATSQSDAIEIDDDSDEDWSPARETASPAKNGANGKSGTRPKDKEQEMAPSSVVQCPMCTHDFTLSALNRHLDTPGACKGPDGPPPSDKERGLAAMPAGSTKSFGGWFSRNGTGPPSKSSSSSPSSLDNATKLKRPQYQLLAEKALRRLCEDAGLSTSGGKATLEARHRHWVDRYNANLDSAPKYRKGLGTLRREMGEWDRERDREEKRAKTGTGAGTGRNNGAASNGAGAVGASEEERRAYAVQHKDHFRELVAMSRQSAFKQQGKGTPPAATREEQADRKEDDGEEGEEAKQREEKAPAIEPVEAVAKEGPPAKPNGLAELDEGEFFGGESWEKDLEES